MSSELWKGCERRGSPHNLKYYLKLSEGTEGNYECLGQDNQYLG